MHPNFSFELFSVPINISAYSLFFWVALVVFFVGSYFFAIKSMQLQGKKVFWCLIIMAASGIVGARLLNAMLNAGLYQEHPQRLWAFRLQGFSIFGSVLAVPAGWLYCRLVKLNVWKMADVLAPFLGAGIAFMRIGCFLNGCCFGKPTKLPWGVVFPDFGRAHIHQIANEPLSFLSAPSAVHPTQIYELLAALAGAGVAFWLIRKKAPTGVAFLVFAVWFASFRLFNNFLRIPPSSFNAPSFFYPMFYLFFIIIGSIALVLRLSRSKK